MLDLLTFLVIAYFLWRSSNSLQDIVTELRLNRTLPKASPPNAAAVSGILRGSSGPTEPEPLAPRETIPFPG